jgi:hypothetical protein
MIDHSQSHINRWRRMIVGSFLVVSRIQARDTVVTVA